MPRVRNNHSTTHRLFSLSPTGGEGSSTPPPGALLRTLLYLLFALLSPLSALASPADALKQYQSGKYDAALKEYDRLRRERPEDARLAFNAGAAAYQAKQFEDATRHFSAATGARDPKLAQSAFYNLGNAHFQMGDAAADPGQKREAWESSLGFYDTALKLDSADTDAKHNHDFVQRKLEELKQQQQPDKQDQKQDDKKDEQKNDQQKKDDQKQDKSGQDKKQDDKKSDDQKQPQKPDGSKPDDQKKQEQPPKPDQPGDQKQPDQKKGQDQKGQPPGQPKQGEKGESGDKDSAQAAALGQMTAQQAMQLLDSQRAEERALIFLPTNATQKANSRTLKNW